MKYLYHRIIVLVCAIGGILIPNACTEQWNDHYDVESFGIPDKTLNTYISEQKDLSTFFKMLEKTGYNTKLNGSQSYTVWAPVNSALEGVDLNNKSEVLEIVKNHIALSRFSSLESKTQSIRMLNGKHVSFENVANGFVFGNVEVQNSNMNLKNGLIHTINGVVPFLPNLWEYLKRGDNLDSIKSYLYKSEVVTFDLENSVQTGVDDDNNAIYDSSFIYSNPILDAIGYINVEDSAYTAILPNNTAWNEAYKRIEKYYNFPSTAGGVQRKREYTQLMLVRDMLYSGRITEPETYDSLVSTTGNIYYNPGSLFVNTSKEIQSNGIAYVTSKMPFTDTASWFREIRIEAERTVGRVNVDNNIYVRYGYGTDFDISYDRYIYVEPTTSNSSVTFSIPNTLSAKYNVYCVFVPNSIVNEEDKKPFKVKFKLSSISSDDGTVEVTEITPGVNTTNPDGLTKMFVKKIDFAFANIQDEEHNSTDVTLEVINAATTEEESNGLYSREMRIDCIILEPIF